MTMESPAKMLETKEEYRDELRIPQRMNLVFGHQEESAQTRLVEGGKGDAEDDRSHGERSKDLPDSLESKPFRHGRREFNKQGDHVEHEVPGDKEEH